MPSRGRQRRQRLEDQRRREEERRASETLREQQRNTSSIRLNTRWVIVATVVAVVLAVVGWTDVFSGSGNGSGDTYSSKQPSPRITPSPSDPLSGGVHGSDINLGCPAPPGPNNRPSLRIRVVEWCAFDAVRGQAQMKLKVWIYNTGATSLDTSIGHLRLLVQTLDPQKWSPPGGPTKSAIRPIQVLDQGVKVWAISANPNGAAEPIPGEPRTDTFATHWNLKTLGPGRQYTPTMRDVGDLVFYIPVTHSTQLQGVLGLAYVDSDGQIAVICPPNHWGPRKAAETF